VFRPFEDPVPSLDYGVAWYEPHISPLVPAFLELAESLAEAPPATEEASLMN
jgi:hypothetical protein